MFTIWVKTNAVDPLNYKWSMNVIVIVNINNYPYFYQVSEMYKTHLLIPSGKLNELYANLSRVNAQIYVQRSRRIQEQGTRTRLLAWIVSDLQLLAMADPTLHSTDNVLANMTNIDPSS